MAAPSPNTRLPGTRSAEAVRDDGQLDFFRTLWSPIARVFRPAKPDRNAVASDELVLDSGTVSVAYVRHPRARRYRLVFRRDGSARCTIPRRGTLGEAKRFVASNQGWLAERLKRHLANPPASQTLRPGDSVWLGGSEIPLSVDADKTTARIGLIEFKLTTADGDLRPAVEAALRKFATRALPSRLLELAKAHGYATAVRRTSVRNQRTRWGSCSRRGVISLNWRLVQTPDFVRDYVILHELAHLKHLNHSARFWAEVERICPGYQTAEQWLKRSGRQVL
jgi:predicted metal-dependent hydrolase